MMIVSDSDVELTSGFQRSAQHGRVVIGRGTASADHRRRCFSLVLRFVLAPLWQAPYYGSSIGQGRVPVGGIGLRARRRLTLSSPLISFIT